MWDKISLLPMMAYVAVSGFWKELEQDERGLSGVVVSVLLILVAVLAVGILWGLLGDWITEMWNNIVGKSQGI